MDRGAYQTDDDDDNPGIRSAAYHNSVRDEAADDAADNAADDRDPSHVGPYLLSGLPHTLVIWLCVICPYVSRWEDNTFTSSISNNTEEPWCTLCNDVWSLKSHELTVYVLNFRCLIVCPDQCAATQLSPNLMQNPFPRKPLPLVTNGYPIVTIPPLRMEPARQSSSRDGLMKNFMAIFNFCPLVISSPCTTCGNKLGLMLWSGNYRLKNVVIFLVHLPTNYN